jgi:hypothetical protein
MEKVAIMRRRKAYTPIAVDRLEDRLTLSHLGIHPAAHVAHRRAAHTAHHRAASVGDHLSGSAPPAPVTTPPAPATGSPAMPLVLSGKIEGPTPMVGTGTISPLGAVSSSGTLRASSAEPMTYKGTVTLVGASGSITLNLSGQHLGPQQIGRTIDLAYTITGGTGAFESATGSGKAVLSFELPSVPRPSPFPSGGAVVLTFGDVS